MALLVALAEVGDDAQNEDASHMEEDEQPKAVSSISLPDVVAMSDDTQFVAHPAADEPGAKVGQKRKQQDSSVNQLPRSDSLCFYCMQALHAMTFVWLGANCQ